MRSKLLTAASTIAILVGTPALALAGPPALPSGGVFATGSTGSISTSGSTQSVTFSNPNGPGVVTWSGGFDVASGNTVGFANNGSGPSTIINNDASGVASAINGTISAPGVSVVVVNPNGISVGSGAVLPSQFALAAGTYDAATGQITASNSPVTIAPGVTLGTAPSTNADSITVIAASGSTLPVSQGVTDNVDVSGSGSSFALSPNSEGDYAFGPQTGASSASIGTVTVDGGSASGATVGSETFTTQAGATGSLTVQNVNSTGSILETTDGYTGGTVTADNLTATDNNAGGFVFGGSGTSQLTVDSIDNVNVAGKLAVNFPAGTTSTTNFSPLITIAEGVYAGNTASDSTLNTDVAQPNGSKQTLTFESGATIDSASGQGGFNVTADNIALGGPVTLEGSSVGGSTISANTSIGAAPGAVDPALKSTSPNLGVEAPSILGVTLSENQPGGNSLLNVSANSISDANLIGSTINIAPPVYDGNAGTAAPTPLNMSNVNISTSGLDVNDEYGASLNDVQMAKPAGGQFPVLDISPGGYNGIPANGYISPGNGPVGLSITNSTLYGASNSIIQAGQPRGNGVVQPGSITVTGSTIESGPNFLEAAGPITLYAAGGGTVSIDSTSTVSSDGSYQCDQSGAACDTSVMSGNIGFGTGNKETASGANVYTGTISGTSNGSPVETSGIANPGQNPGGVLIETYSAGQAPAGSATIDGYLDAGGVTPPSNVGPAGPAGATGATGPAGPAGANGSNGTNGVGIASTSINSSGDLIVTLTNGSTQNAGAVVGATGATGSNGTNGVGIQSATVNSSGDLIVTLTNGQTQNAGSVVGATGANGSNGTNGVGIQAATVNSSGDLIVTLTNGNSVDAGRVLGATGATGANGTNGTNGLNGVGIASTSINSSGDLIITLTNGTTQNAGAVVGATGQNGVGIASASVNSAGDLIVTLTNGTSTNAGSVVGATGATGVGIQSATVNSSGDLIVTLTNGTSANAGRVLGATGATGDQGPQGPVGPMGPQGPAGPAGLDGVEITTTDINKSGDLIITLSNGEVIDNGKVVGETGPQGPQGPAGPQGPVGPQGPAGLNGANTIISTGLATVSPISVTPSSQVSTPTLTGNQMLVPESSNSTGTSAVSVEKNKKG